MSFIPLSKADVDILEKEKREIERRRREEADRKKRFFNDKQRQMGVDADFIAQQIDDKQKVKSAAKEEDRQYRQKVESFVEKLAVLDSDRIKYQKSKTYEVGQFQKNSSVKDCDTWPLNDPDRIKNAVPPRTEDTQDIPSCALQKFDGEDLSKNDRIKRQQSELKQWCDSIVAEKQSNIAAEKKEVMDYVQQRDHCLEQLAKVEVSKRVQDKQNSIHCANDNLVQRAQKVSREEEAQSVESAKAQKEVAQMLESQFLNETWNSTLRSGQENRFIPYNFKGFSQEQKQAILNTQSEQIKQQEEVVKGQERREQEYHREQQEYGRKALLQLRNAQRMKLQRKSELADTHKTQIVETQEKTEELNTVYANKVTPEFFKQFGTSTR